MVRIGLGCCRDTNLHLGVNLLQNLGTLVCRLRPEQVLLVNHHNDGQTRFFLRSASYLIERGVLLRFAHHHVLLLVDALPVHKQDFARFYRALALVYLVVHHRLQQSGLREVVLHLEVALLVQLVRSYPDECHLLVRTVAPRLQLLRQVCQHLRCHHRLTRTRRRLEYQSFPVTRQSQQVDGHIHQLAHIFLLILYFFHCFLCFIQILFLTLRAEIKTL